jgi:dipeptide/tripeptide permease
LGYTVNTWGVTISIPKRHFFFIPGNICSFWNVVEVPLMSHRTSQSLIAVLIRVGLLLALVVMLMAENAQAQL